ncbi:MAG: homoserine dehydrogenase [Candidatus Altiarchaeales archaeon]|nr:homoserine dehydrogenase [Candidatus Altiarchaeales archaeon]
MKKIRITLIGFGVIGRGFIETLHSKRGLLLKQGLDFSVTCVCEKNGSIISDAGLDLEKLLETEFSRHPDFTETPTLKAISSQPADILVECTPGDIKTGRPGLDHINEALSCGMHVVTSNKSPIVRGYRELADLSQKTDKKLLYEATVAGSIPLLSLKKPALAGCEIKNIYGILNGTSNFVLSKMAEEGVDFELALDEAKQLGYAETDPTYDVEGIDTAAKVVILANYFMDGNLSFEDLRVEGVTKITPESIKLAGEHGYHIKLLGDVNSRSVTPRLIPIGHPLDVSGSLNAVLIETDLAGEITLVGAGAGAKETSQALLSDVLSIAYSIQSTSTQ